MDMVQYFTCEINQTTTPARWTRKNHATWQLNWIRPESISTSYSSWINALYHCHSYGNGCVVNYQSLLIEVMVMSEVPCCYTCIERLFLRIDDYMHRLCCLIEPRKVLLYQCYGSISPFSAHACTDYVPSASNKFPLFQNVKQHSHTVMAHNNNQTIYSRVWFSNLLNVDNKT